MSQMLHEWGSRHGGLRDCGAGAGAQVTGGAGPWRGYKLKPENPNLLLTREGGDGVNAGNNDFAPEWTLCHCCSARELAATLPRWTPAKQDRPEAARGRGETRTRRPGRWSCAVLDHFAFEGTYELLSRIEAVVPR